MSPILAAIFVFLTYIAVRLLHLASLSSPPLIYAKDRSSQFVQSILTLCPILQQPYVPPLLWGKSGHIQTFVYAKMGRVKIPVPSGVRHMTIMPDGATLTFDLHEPLVPHRSGACYCLLFCPGIGNNSESPYMRTLVHYAQEHGYTAVVLNHLGSLKNVELTSPRVFTYGGTEELDAVKKEVERLHPKCGLILVGCSMGGNIVVKYLGENVANQVGVLAAVSINQGYDVNKAKTHLLSWSNMRRAYIYVMTRNQKNMIKRHRHQLLNEKIKSSTGIDEVSVFAARTISELDEAYTRKRHGFKTIEDYYYHNSCSRYLPNVETPLLLVNSEDDPIVPPPLLECPLEATKVQPNMIFALTKHGGHLGFFEKGFLTPDRITWMDRLIIEYADAITTLHQDGSLPLLPPSIRKLHHPNDEPEHHEESSIDNGDSEDFPTITRNSKDNPTNSGNNVIGTASSTRFSDESKLDSTYIPNGF